MREPGLQPAHRVRRPDGSVSRAETKDCSAPTCPGSDEQLVEGAGEHRQRARGRQRHRTDVGQPRGVELHQPRLLLLPGLAERVGQRRPAVAQPRGQGLWPVQVAQRDVVDAVEDRGGHEVDAADADVALALAGLPAADEGVRQHHRPRPRSQEQIGTHPVHRLGQHRLVAARARQAELETGDLRLEVGQAVDRHVAVLVGEQDRLVETRCLGAHVQTTGREQLGEGAQPAGRVVVAGGQHDRRAGAAQPRHDPARAPLGRPPTGTARS